MRSMNIKKYIQNRINMFATRKFAGAPVIACVFCDTIKAYSAKIRIMNYLIDHYVSPTVKTAISLEVYDHLLLFLSENCGPHDVAGRNFTKMFEHVEDIEVWCLEQQKLLDEAEVAKWASWGAMSSYICGSAFIKCAKKRTAELKGVWA